MLVYAGAGAGATTHRATAGLPENLAPAVLMLPQAELPNARATGVWQRPVTRLVRCDGTRADLDEAAVQDAATLAGPSAAFARRVADGRRTLSQARWRGMPGHMLDAVRLSSLPIADGTASLDTVHPDVAVVADPRARSRGFAVVDGS